MPDFNDPAWQREQARRIVLDHAKDVDFSDVGDMLAVEAPEDVLRAVHDLCRSAAVTVTWPGAEPPDFDLDPVAVAWARGKVQRYVDQCANFERQGTERGEAEMASQWRRTKNYLRMKFIGGEGCVIASFDERLPELKRALEGAQPFDDRT